VLVTTLQDLFGETPRVKLLEALLRLAPVEFSAPEAAKEAGLHKPSAYAEVEALKAAGLIERVSETRPATFRVAEDSGVIPLLSAFDSALQLLPSGLHTRLPRRATLALAAESFASLGGRAADPSEFEEADAMEGDARAMKRRVSPRERPRIRR